MLSCVLTMLSFSNMILLKSTFESFLLEGPSYFFSTPPPKTNLVCLDLKILNLLQQDTDLITFQHHLPQAYCQAACWVKLPLRGNLSVFKYAKPFKTFSEWSLACRELGCLHSWNYLYYILAIVVVVVNWGNTSKKKKHHRLSFFLSFFFHKFTVFNAVDKLTFDLWKVNWGEVFHKQILLPSIRLERKVKSVLLCNRFC